MQTLNENFAFIFFLKYDRQNVRFARTYYYYYCS
jgi:hypothetical protein